MNKWRDAHSEDEDLLRYLDGELATEESESVGRHLDACWSCRMHADGIQSAILEYARWRERTPAPEPPRPWKNLMGDLLQVEQSSSSRSVRNRRLGLFFALAGALMAATWFVLPRERNAEPKISPMPAAIEPPRPTAPSRVIPKAILPDAHDPVPAGPHEELAVIAVLHRLRADLGEPVDLERGPNGGLTLTVFGLSPERSQAISTAMRAIPGVRIHFPQLSNAGAGTVPAEPSRVAGRPVAFEEKLLQHLGTKRQLEQFTNSVLDLSDQALTRAHALSKLDERFHHITQLDYNDQAVLASIRSDHYRAMAHSVEQLHHLLDPVFGVLDVPNEPPPQTDLLATALRLDKLLNAALAGAQSELSDRNLYAELRGYLARLAELTEK